MQRGADTVLFDPAKRAGATTAFTLGFVGRVTPEKSVRFLVDIERALMEAGLELQVPGGGRRQRAGMAQRQSEAGRVSGRAGAGRRWRELTPIWTCSCFLPAPILSGTW